MEQEALYSQYARYYNLLYSTKNYEQEVEQVRSIIEKHIRSAGNHLLEIGCGTGQHLVHFKKYYQCTGVDINGNMLNVARQQLPEVPFFVQDMSALQLNQQFDVISSLFSSIGYVTEHSALVTTFAGMAAHLKPGGVLIIEPWISPGSFTSGHMHMTTYDSEDVKIARMGISTIEGNLSIMDMHYMVAEKGKGVLNWVDRNQLAMYEHADLLAMLADAGINAHMEQPAFTGRGLIVGVKE